MVVIFNAVVIAPYFHEVPRSRTINSGLCFKPVVALSSSLRCFYAYLELKKGIQTNLLSPMLFEDLKNGTGNIKLYYSNEKVEQTKCLVLTCSTRRVKANFISKHIVCHIRSENRRNLHFIPISQGVNIKTGVSSSGSQVSVLADEMEWSNALLLWS